MHLHSGEWYNAPVNFLGLMCICQTLEISSCEKCSCGFISFAGFWVRVLFCGFAFGGCWLFPPPPPPAFKQLNFKGKKFISSSPSKSRFTILHTHSYFAFDTVSELCLLLHEAICFIILS